MDTYDRVATISVLAGLKLIREAEESGQRIITIDGYAVRVHTSKLAVFLHKGVVCANSDCKVRASFFAIERSNSHGSKNPPDQYLLNLWGLTPDDQEVLFTRDHIIARGMGGSNDLTNSQTMCYPHNQEKSFVEDETIQKLWIEQRSQVVPLDRFQFKYIGGKNTVFLRSSEVSRKSINMFINNPDKWCTERLVKIVWRHAGFLCSEVRYVKDNHRIDGRPKHRYDLCFHVGPGLLESNRQVNALVRAIEKDIRAELDVEMVKDHGKS